MNNNTESHALEIVRDRPLATSAEATQYNVHQVLEQIALVQQVMSVAMKDGEHYGKIPGCGTKPTLLKPGAEKLCLTFRLAPTYVVEERQLERGHREYRVQCSLTSIITQAFIGQGVGTCSTMEAKYRYRGNAAELTDKAVPRAYWDLKKTDSAKAQELIGGKGFSTKKNDEGVWMIAKAGGERAENPDLADTYNTVLKMSKKRALVDAVLTATAASDIFTQDLEDIRENLALAGAEHQPTASNQGCSLRRVDSGASAPRASAPAPATSSTEKQRYDADPHQGPLIPANDPVDLCETRIHFGKNRGLMLSELSPQQVHWYEHDWMPKKEVNGPTSVEDLALINAIKAYSAWRSGGHRAARASKPQGGQAAPRPVESQPTLPVAKAAPVEAKPEDETQERPSEIALFRAKLAEENIEEEMFVAFLRTPGRKALPDVALSEGELLSDLEISDLAKLVLKWDPPNKQISVKKEFVAFRREGEKARTFATHQLN